MLESLQFLGHYRTVNFRFKLSFTGDTINDEVLANFVLYTAGFRETRSDVAIALITFIVALNLHHQLRFEITAY